VKVGELATDNNVSTPPTTMPVATAYFAAR
jgi:hypothetical protein